MGRAALHVLAMLVVGCGGRDVPASSSGSGAGAAAQGMSHPDASLADVQAFGPDASAPDSDMEDDAAPDGPLPACSWTTPALPPDSGPVQIAADRTVLICGVGNVNNTFCLSASATECTAVSAYGVGGPCQQQCSPCMMLCAVNEYAIGVGMPQYQEPLPGGYPFQTPTLPSSCRSLFMGRGFLPPLLPADLFWSYSCCPCE